MILMWLVPVVFMIGGLAVFRTGVAQCFSLMQKKFLALPEDCSTLKMLLVSKLCALSLGSFVGTQYSAVALLNARSSSRHYALLLLCLAAAGSWTTMLAIILAWKVNGSLLLGIGVAFLFYSRWTQKGHGLFNLTAGLGAFLLGARMALQDQALLMTFLGEGEFHFLLADGRLPAQLLWMVVSFALTLVIAIESWAVILALVLWVSGSLSLNGAVAMILGEILAHVVLLWWRSRKLNQDVQDITKTYALTSAFGLLVAFFATGTMRDLFAWTFTFEGGPLVEKTLQLFCMYLVIMVCQSVATSAWGHFAARRKVDEVQKGDYFPPRWIGQRWVSAVVAQYIVGNLEQRWSLLQAQQQNLNLQERAQIPKAYLQDHEQEIQQLALWVPLAQEQSAGLKNIY